MRRSNRRTADIASIEPLDARRLLAAAPELLYSTFLGGEGYDAVNDVAVGPDGSVYVTGQASTATFPTTAGAFQRGGNKANTAAFVTKYRPDGTVAYSTYLGGTWGSYTVGQGIAIDASGSAYVTGELQANDFPITPGAYASPQYDWDVFVTKLSADGASLEYSARIGGEWADFGRDIAVDAAGNAFITGHTYDYGGDVRMFPSTPGAFQPAHGGGQVDAFVTKLSADGSTLLYSTYLGGPDDNQSAGGYEFGEGIAVDAAGNAYVTGDVRSATFPTTPGAFDRALGGAQDVFLTKLNASGSALVYSTFLGGEFSEVGGRDYGRAVAVDATGHAYVTGWTDAYRPTVADVYPASFAFPTTPRAFQKDHSGFLGDVGPNLTEEAFVTKFAPDGGSLVYSTYLGGSTLNDGWGQGMDRGMGIAVDAAGFATVAGETQSPNFPIHNALPGGSTYPGGSASVSSAFATRLSPDGSSLAYSTYLGQRAEGKGVALTPDGSVAVVAGATRSMASPAFPITLNAAQTINGGDGEFNNVTDGFVSRVTNTSPAARSVLGLTLAPKLLPRGQRATITVTINEPAPAGGTVVTLTNYNPDTGSVPATITIPEGQTTASVQTGVLTLPPDWDDSVGKVIVARLDGSKRVAELTITPTGFAATATTFDVNGSGGPTVRVTFAVNIARDYLTADDLVITDRTTGVVVGTAAAVTYSAATRTATFRLPTTLPDGDLRATLPGGSVIAVGNVPLSPDASVDFFTLAGDADRDRRVGFSDLLIVARNYDTIGRTFAQGNLDYSTDGRVDFGDLLVLAGRYNQAMSASLLASRSSPTSNDAKRRVAGDVLL